MVKVPRVPWDRMRSGERKLFLSKRVWLGLFGLSTCVVLLLTCSNAAFAWSWWWWIPPQSTPAPVQAPEIDPMAAVSGLMLCAGSALILLERYRKRK
jgi:hypothetical protein